MPNLTLINRASVDGFAQTDDGVRLAARNLDSGDSFTVDCQYLVGCDGLMCS